MKSIKQTLLWQALVKFVTSPEPIFQLDRHRYLNAELKLLHSQVMTGKMPTPRQNLKMYMRNVAMYFNRAMRQVVESEKIKRG
jgi:hypothetical protein